MNYCNDFWIDECIPETPNSGVMQIGDSEFFCCFVTKNKYVDPITIYIELRLDL